MPQNVFDERVARSYDASSTDMYDPAVLEPAVDFLAAAVAHGAEVLHEARVWPEYHEHYYGAFVRDPDGNNVEAVCHLPA